MEKEQKRTSKKKSAKGVPGMEKDLREIYQSEDGKLPDFSTLERTKNKRTRNTLVVAVAFFALLAAAAWAGFFVFKPFQRFGGTGLAISISGPETLTAGREETFLVRYDNRERVPLGTVEIVLTIPATFQLASAEPPATEGNRWVLGNVAVGGNGEIALRGRVVGGLGETSGVQAFATYIPGNFNSEFQSVGSYSAPITSSVVTATGELPESAFPGDQITYTVKYQNTGDSPIPDAVVQATYPQQFLFQSSEPAASEGKALWRVGELAAGGSGSIAIKGAFSAEASGPQSFQTSIGQQMPDTPFAAYATASSSIQIIGGELRTLLLVNGSEKGQPLNFGDSMRISLVYENRGTESIKNVELALHLDAVPSVGGKTVIDWETLDDENEGKREGSVITWTKRDIAVLGNLEPGGEGTIDVGVKLRDAPFADSGSTYAIDGWIAATIGSIGARVVDRTVQTSRLAFPLNSDARLAAGARYYNDDEIPVGTGPLPPEVGDTTNVRIFWSVSNSLHELSNVIVSTVLPEGVQWTNKVFTDAGEIGYDPANRRVLWTINRMPTTVAALGANFEVAVTPAESNVGSPIALTNSITLDADDPTNQSHLTRTVPSLDTNLEGDPVASGRGVVVR